MTDKEALGYINFSKVFQKTKTFIDTHNEKHCDLKAKLNASHRATAELIIRMYVKQLNQAISLGDSFKKGLPGFRTYNSSLASCKGCTVKTILNHKRRLKQAGFISYEQNRGKSGIELWVNMDVFGQRVKNLHPLVHVQQEQVNNNRGVDKLITSKKGVHLSVHKTDNNCVTGTEQEQDMNTEESRIFDSKKQIKDLKKESDSAFSLQLIRNFWRYARVILYTHKLYSEPEEAEILNHIWSSVYLKFKIEGNKEDWKEYQDILYKRIDMVSRWLERDSNR
ncbi:hypothetical protein [Aquimarina spongiae]|uniref:Uncharacterized protein n=1 Tax=Aquimarina spongiae TaxID=570521 RepID=A0A1M6JN14_9FLAO|nr:hypothetical protein [Aquimarina spongiae]SHJ48127.1 hypothetical protein SAMN04488508_109156 [Aquimarina spongiae]